MSCLPGRGLELGSPELVPTAYCGGDPQAHGPAALLPCLLPGPQGAEALKAPALVSCGPETSLRTALELLVSEHVHRLWVVDERHRPLGIVTITGNGRQHLMLLGG